MPGPVVSPELPEWLRENRSLSDLLSDQPQKGGFDNRKIVKKLSAGQRRTILIRDTELFVAHGREIRCADLKDIKAATEKSEVYTGSAYQTLDLPNIDFDISQIIRSADGETMIVVGEYDIGVALLPAPGVITPGTRSKLALKIYEVEFNKEGSFSEATEVLDLKKMLGIERSGSYLMDDLEPASICFGGVGSIWSMFTLYILMKNGEIYSICPFLPSKWMLDSDFIEELTYELQLNQETRDSPDQSVPALDKHNAKQICFWIHEVFRLIRVQKLAGKGNDLDDEPAGYILPKPMLPEFEDPLLQGPYLLQPAPEDILDDSVFATDITRIGAAQYAVIAVAWSTGRVDILLEFESVVPRWQSSSLKNKKFNDRSPYPVVSGFESINIPLPAATENSSAIYPSLTIDINFPHSILLNHGFGVELLSLDDWMSRLSKVIDQEDDEGAIEAALSSVEKTSVVHAVARPRGNIGAPNPVFGSALVYDAYLGYLLLSATSAQPGFAVLQWPSRYNLKILKLKQERSDLSSVSSKAAPLTQTSNNLNEDAIAAVQRQVAECRQRLLLFKQMVDPRILRSEVQINHESISIITRLKDMLFEEMDARYASAQQIHAHALQQQKRFHEQIGNIRRFAEQLEEQEKKQEALREKVKKTQENQEKLNARVDGVLSKLAAVSKKGGFPLMSQAEQDYVEEVHGIEKIVKQISTKQQKITEFLETLSRVSVSEGESSKLPAKTDPEKEAGDSNRQELSKMVAKEHRMISDIRKKVDNLEHQLQEIKLGA
ncbi:hypothetical protein ABW19_dt0204563 [Dactylella cylindrospora]|nr:hypothetical protein ABW19_dt0204563 [Dactylella cylindrospora]